MYSNWFNSLKTCTYNKDQTYNTFFSTLKSWIIVYVQLFFWRKNSILYRLIQVYIRLLIFDADHPIWCLFGHAQLLESSLSISNSSVLWKVAVFRARNLKYNWGNRRKMKPTLPIPVGSAAYFLFPEPTRSCMGSRCMLIRHYFVVSRMLLCTISYFSTLYYYSVLYYYWLFEILPPYMYYYFTLYCY